MSTKSRGQDHRSQVGPRAVRATIGYRLLVNALADPEEVAPRLPEGLRPHATDQGSVVGHCLVDLAEVRPAPLPRRAGIRLRAVAHRMAVEWDAAGGESVVGVYVAVRHTDSAWGCALGGRVFPGVHERAAIGVDRVGDRVVWTVDPDVGPDLGVHVAANLEGRPVPPAHDQVAATCLLPDLGVSPGRRGTAEAVRMQPEHQRGQLVQVQQLRSGFLDSFETARSAPSFVVRDVQVTWSWWPRPAGLRHSAGEIVRL